MVKPVCKSHSATIIEAYVAAYQAGGERITSPGPAIQQRPSTQDRGCAMLYYTVVPSLLRSDWAAHTAIVMVAEDAVVKLRS